MEHKNYDLLRLNCQSSFPLYACSREVIRLYTPLLDKLGLTYTQYITMMVLWEKTSLRVKDLGHELHLDSGTLTPLLKKLEEKQLVTRKRSPEDERNLIVTITPLGESLREQALAIPYEIARYSNLTQEENQTLRDLLYKLLNHISAIRE